MVMSCWAGPLLLLFWQTAAAGFNIVKHSQKVKTVQEGGNLYLRQTDIIDH